MTTDIYKYAAQNRLLFPSNRGDLTLQDLFDMPLSSRSGFDLDNVAKAVNNELKACGEESFVSTAATNPKKKPLEVALDVVKDVIATKLALNAEALARQHKAEERRKILDAISTKKDQALTSASIDELEKKLAALDV